eukprot:scaffold6519_cov101-Isochrysis_galbana.AAC.1
MFSWRNASPRWCEHGGVKAAKRGRNAPRTREPHTRPSAHLHSNLAEGLAELLQRLPRALRHDHLSDGRGVGAYA